MKTEEIMKDRTYNNEFNEKDKGYLSDISDENSKPQMNADERRYVQASCFGKRIHRKGHKEREAVQHESLRPLRSLRLNAFFSPAHERTPPAPAVHPRLSRAGG